MEKQIINAPSSKEIIDNLLHVKSEMNSNTEEIIHLVSVKHIKLNGLRPLKSIIDEICDCIILNKQCAAITLTNYLLEATLKLSLILWKAHEKPFDNTKSFEAIYENEVKLFIGKEMSKNIASALEEKLIDEEEKDDLEEMMIEYRNHIDHASNNTIIRNARTMVATWDLRTNKTNENLNAKITGNPMLYISAQIEFMRECAYNYFMHVVSYILKWDKMLHERYEQCNT